MYNANEEKYITFSNEIVLYDRADVNGEKIQVKREIKFIDNFRFMPSSLDALIKTWTRMWPFRVFYSLISRCVNINMISCFHKILY